MGRRIKRGTVGNAAQYVTRNQAIKKLQLSLAQFRRICILKGIHPREPKKKVQGANKTYYHVKDINWLLHEPLLNTFRQIKSHERKIRKAQAKLNPELAKRLAALTPSYRLDHLVKERYPSFMDALRDLDDPLTMVHLFATLPAEKRYEIPRKQVDTARRLALEWQAFVVRAHALRKVFVSVKGFYYQAEIMGQQVTWLVPHQLAQVLPTDVDYKVLLTFLEFYLTLLQFINFKLYHTIGLRYPPSLDPKLEAASAELEAIMRELAGLRDHSEAQFEAEEKKMIELEGNEAAQKKLASLKDKIKELGEQQDDEQQADSDDDEAAGSEEEGSDEELPDIDSGDEEGSEDEDEDEEEQQGSEEQDEQQQSDDEDLTFSAAARSAGTATTSAADEDDEGRRVAGGALTVDGSDEAAVCSQLLKGNIFYLSREVPREPLMFVIRAFGGEVAYDGEGSLYKEADEAITHQVVDRPSQAHRFLSRQYVQPQWVFDSCNFRVLMPAELYAPGKVPPPHLSPFVNNEEEGYTPEFAETVKQLQEAAAAARARAAGALPAEAGFVGEGDEGTALVALSDPVAAAEAAEKLYAAELAKELRGADAAGSDEDSEQEEQAEAPQKQQKQAGKKRGAADDVDEAAMADIMMTRKTRKFYERIKRSQEGKRERVEVLEQRKAALQKKQRK